MEITLLKVRHASVREAEKLFPYIRDSDIFGIERAGMSGREASNAEQWWEKILEANGDRRSEIDKFLARHNIEDQEERAYYAVIYASLFQQRRLIWHTERFSRFNAEGITFLQQAGDNLYEQAGRFLEGGNLEGFFRSYHASIVKDNQGIDLRDQEVARNLAMAEEKIRKRYPSLQNVQPLKYTLFMGVHHEPENFFPDIRVEPLAKVDFRGKVASAVRQGALVGDLRKEMLALALECFEVPPAQSMAMEYESLVQYALGAMQRHPADG